jgi:hypothetical protein
MHIFSSVVRICFRHLQVEVIELEDHIGQNKCRRQFEVHVPSADLVAVHRNRQHEELFIHR